ncbi:MAG TPA: type I-U CRISPR-associated RAMP protein Csb1/Cas7u [Acidimicrobiales bacterium]|nr:type I-U CRISPR-associated RAMP protein Csb1/Cas7u [Acidimicrobiales bacterium]
MEALRFDDLFAAIEGSAAAFRCRRRLQPAGGPGDKVFPPTFAGGDYAFEKRVVPGRDQPVDCVLMDSVQSQANRMELALQEACDAGAIALPLLVVDFSDYDPVDNSAGDGAGDRLIESVGRLTSLEVPHRLADAILRDSELAGVRFRHSIVGKALNSVRVSNATALFELCPTALVFGMWDSTGPKGGLGPKFERALVSEMVGVGAVWEDTFRSRGLRRDPLEISKVVSVVRGEDRSLLRVAAAKESGAVRPSEINHSNVPFDVRNSGLTVEWVEQTTTLSLICLRRLRFPLDGRTDAAIDARARAVLAALGLAAATLAFEAGVDLRSRCVLWPEGAMVWELLERPGETPRSFALSPTSAISLLGEAVAAARAVGLPWNTEPIVLKPSAELVKLVRLSQLEAARESVEAL